MQRQEQASGESAKAASVPIVSPSSPRRRRWGLPLRTPGIDGAGRRRVWLGGGAGKAVVSDGADGRDATTTESADAIG